MYMYKRPRVLALIASQTETPVVDRFLSFVIPLASTHSLVFRFWAGSCKMVSSRLSFALSLVTSCLVAAQTCKLQFEGRVPTDLTILDFDKANDFFSEKFVLGQGLTFSQALRLLPAGAGSLVRHPLTRLPSECINVVPV